MRWLPVPISVSGRDITTGIVDMIKDYGFNYAMLSGTTIAVSDLTIPEERDEVLARADKNVQRAERDFRRGLDDRRRTLSNHC